MAGPQRGTDQRDELVRRAARDHSLVMHYQPRIRILDGAVVGFEALMRLRTGGGALLSPAEFLGRAEAVGVLEQLELDALRQVCRQTAAWSDAGLRLQGSVNVSMAWVRSGAGLSGAVGETLAETGLAPRQLALELPAELSENISVDTVRELSELKKLGVMLTLEDFGAGIGTGSVERLAGLGFGELKLDRRLVAAIPDDQEIGSHLRMYATQMRALGLRCIAAGVETPQQHTFLVGVGIELAQGYYYERPLPADSFVELVKEPAGVVSGRR